MVQNILMSFRKMLDSLQWIANDNVTMQGAISKIQNLKQNYAFPDFILNNMMLEQYYDGLEIEETNSYFEMRANMDEFNFRLTYKVLMKPQINGTAVDRNDFSGPPGTVNAWYMVRAYIQHKKPCANIPYIFAT